MAFLALDTSTTSCSVALYDEKGACLAFGLKAEARGHDQIIFGLIQKVLEEGSCSLKDVTQIGVTMGPGSFTGLRVGLACAQGLSLPYQIPIRGVSTFEVLLAEKPPVFTPSLILIDSQTGSFYGQEFSAEGEPVEAAKVWSAEEILKWAEAHISPSILATVALPEAFPSLDWCVASTSAHGVAKTLLQGRGQEATVPLYIKAPAISVPKSYEPSLKT